MIKVEESGYGHNPYVPEENVNTPKENVTVMNKVEEEYFLFSLESKK